MTKVFLLAARHTLQVSSAGFETTEYNAPIARYEDCIIVVSINVYLPSVGYVPCPTQVLCAT